MPQLPGAAPTQGGPKQRRAALCPLLQIGHRELERDEVRLDVKDVKYQIDPLSGPEWGGQKKVVAFTEPPQAHVIEKILRHCGLWCPSSPRTAPTVDGWTRGPDGDADSQAASAEEFRGLT